MGSRSNIAVSCGKGVWVKIVSSRQRLLCISGRLVYIKNQKHARGFARRCPKNGSPCPFPVFAMMISVKIWARAGYRRLTVPCNSSVAMGGINKIQHLDRVPCGEKEWAGRGNALLWGRCIPRIHRAECTAANTGGQIPGFCVCQTHRIPRCVLVERRIVRQDYQGTPVCSKNGSLEAVRAGHFQEMLAVRMHSSSLLFHRCLFAARKVARIHIAAKPLAQPKTCTAHDGDGQYGVLKAGKCAGVSGNIQTGKAE